MFNLWCKVPFPKRVLANTHMFTAICKSLLIDWTGTLEHLMPYDETLKISAKKILHLQQNMNTSSHKLDTGKKEESNVWINGRLKPKQVV